MRGAVTTDKVAIAALLRGFCGQQLFVVRAPSLPRKLKKACLQRIVVHTQHHCELQRLSVRKFTARIRRKLWSFAWQDVRIQLVERHEKHLSVAYSSALEELMQQEDRATLHSLRNARSGMSSRQQTLED